MTTPDGATIDTVRAQQQARVAALAAILDLPGLAAACWNVHAGATLGQIPDLTGQLDTQNGRSVDRFRAVVADYAAALGLTVEDDQYLSETSYCHAYTRVGASGEFMGVNVSIWGAAR